MRWEDRVDWWPNIAWKYKPRRIIPRKQTDDFEAGTGIRMPNSGRQED
jgi:hypothetical protein